MIKKFTILKLACTAICALAMHTVSAQWITVGPVTGPGFNVYTMMAMGNDLYAGGASQANSGMAKWDGTSWTSLGKVVPTVSQPVLGVNAMVVYNNELYVGGDIDSIGGTFIDPTIGVARYDGTSWHALGTSAFNLSGVACLAVYNNELYAGGNYGVNKWDGTSWTNISTTGKVNALVVYNNELYAAGNFTHIGGVAMTAGKGFAKWNGTTWTVLPGFYDTLTQLPNINVANAASMIVYKGELYVIGVTYAGTTRVRGVGRWNGTTWNGTNGGLTGNGQLSQDCMAIDSNNLYVVGPVQRVNTTNDSIFLSTYWDGTRWHPMFGGNAPYTSFFAIANFNNTIYSSFTPLVKWTGISNSVQNVNEVPCSIYPNPSNGEFHLLLNTNETAKIEVMNTAGDVVYKALLAKGEKDHIIRLAGQPAGMYFAAVEVNGSKTVKKIIIQ